MVVAQNTVYSPAQGYGWVISTVEYPDTGLTQKPYHWIPMSGGDANVDRPQGWIVVDGN